MRSEALTVAGCVARPRKQREREREGEGRGNARLALVRLRYVAGCAVCAVVLPFELTRPKMVANRLF